MNHTGIYVVGFTRQHKADGTHVDWVEISNRDNLGSNGHPVVTTRHRVRGLRPDMGDFSRLSAATVDAKRRAMSVVWEVVGPAYEAWLSGQDMPEHGTPLAAWAGITPDRAAAFSTAGFKTVEEIAGATDERISRVRLPDARRVALAAKEWLKGRESSALAAELAELKALLAANGIEATRAAAAEAPADEPELALADDDEFEETPKPRARRRASAGA